MIKRDGGCGEVESNRSQYYDSRFVINEEILQPVRICVVAQGKEGIVAF